MKSQPIMLGTRTVAELHALVARHKDAIQLPKMGRWQSMTDTQIWIAMVGQVGVVGNSKPAEKMIESLSARPGWYEDLVLQSPDLRQSTLHMTLRAFGIRYSSDLAENCRKTKALTKNLSFVVTQGGPGRYLTRVAGMTSEDARIRTIIRDLAFIKNKGARDFLIGVGLIENAIAFDVRIKNVLEALGADLPKDVASNRTVYKQLESELIEKVCKPCGVTGAILDRVLYQKYTEILPKKKTRKTAASC